MCHIKTCKSLWDCVFNFKGIQLGLVMTFKLRDKLVKIQYEQKKKPKPKKVLYKHLPISRLRGCSERGASTSIYIRIWKISVLIGRIWKDHDVQALKKSIYCAFNWTPTNSSLNQKADSSGLLAEDSVNSRYLPKQVFKSEMWWSTFRSTHCSNFNAQQVRKLRMSYGQFAPDVGVCWHTPSRNVEYFWGLLAGVL